MSFKIRRKYIFATVITLFLTGIAIAYINHQDFKPQSSSVNQLSSQPRAQFEVTEQNSEESNKIKNIAQSKGAEAAWQYVIDTYEKNSVDQIKAHDYAHLAGKLIFEKKGLAGITTCTPNFAFGCYHGLLDQAFKNDLSLLTQAEKECAKVDTVHSGPYASCVHGIGHGVASYYKVTDLASALKTCDKLPKNAPQYCYDGVFMEFSREAVDSFYKPDDLLYPCNTIDLIYAYACGRNLPSVMMGRFSKSFTDVATACQQARNNNLKTSCYVALGFQSVYMAEGDPQKIVATCESIRDENFRYQCKSAAAGELIFQNMSGWQDNSPRICNSIANTQQQQYCSDHLTEIQQNYGR